MTSRWHGAASRLSHQASVRLAGSHRARHHVSQALKGIGAGIGYAVLVETRWLQTTHVDVPIPGLPESLDGYRVVHLTDIHHNIAQGAGFLRRVVELCNALDPDMIALTGDFITHSHRRMEPCLWLLSELRAPDGLWAVRGNHDFGFPMDRLQRAMEASRIRLLENAHTVFTPVRRRVAHPEGPACGARITVAGVGDLWTARCSPGEALEGHETDSTVILLSHNPAVMNILPQSPRIHLVLSGHTHGGQVRPFRKSIPMFSGFERRYVSGLVRNGDTTLYVSRGVGTSALHVRWNCRPEIALITLRRE